MRERPPEDFKYEWAPDADWTTDPDIVDGKLCRFTIGPGHTSCREPAVAALNRRYSWSGKTAPKWWRYCGAHLYGRRVRNGVVEVRRLVKETHRILSMTERQFSGLIQETARRLKWRTVHHWSSQHSEVGWPDWAFCNGERLVLAELKVGRAQPTQAQRDWLTDLARAGEEVYLVRPADFEEFATVLQSRVGSVPVIGARWCIPEPLARPTVGHRFDEREERAA